MFRIAETCRALGAELLGIDPDDPRAEVDLAGVDPVTQEEARVLMERAGDYYHRHAKAIIVADAEAAGGSQWLAADSYERAGDIEKAIRFYRDFLQTQAGHPMAVEARHRLARAHQARGDLDSAIKLFEEIIEENPASDPAARSYVPLARSYVVRGEPEDAARARGVLERVLSGELFRPESIHFQSALIELGRLNLREGKLPEAIERLTEAIERYPDIEEAPALRFDLAEAYRRSAEAIEEKLEEAMPQGERTELERTMRNRLSMALDLYEQVRSSLERIEPEQRDEVQAQMLRNAIFFRGDCAFDLGDYDAAIRYYDTAAQRYAGEPASLVAMVQIVNCYMRLGKMREALTAHERARARLNELPPDVWSSGETVLRDRSYWEDWLESSEKLARTPL